MMDPLHFGVDVIGEQPYDLSTAQNPDRNHTHALEHEFLVQHYVESQMLSPSLQTHRRRQDSFFSHSPSSGSKSGGPSPHRAAAQPWLPTTHAAQQDQMSHPRLVAMGRSESQQSTRSRHQTHYDQHHASLKQGSGIIPSHMSRTTTQHSDTSMGCQPWSTAPSPCGPHPQSELTGYVPWNDGYVISTSSATELHCDPVSTAAGVVDPVNLLGVMDSGLTKMTEGGGMNGMFYEDSNRSGTFRNYTFNK
jgi:hypothetical protein